MADRLLHLAAVPFEAACRVLALPEGHRARRLHGHSFLADLRVALPPQWATFPGAEVDQLRQVLAETVAVLDYNDLNTLLDDPTDENLARWIRARAALPGIEAVGVQSTAQSGVDLDGRDHAHVWRRYAFQAAHQLPRVPPGHKCGNMHGHGFEVILHANRDLAGSAYGIDYDHLDAVWAPIHDELDHACLNDIPGLENPTSEQISAWIWGRLKPVLPELSWVTVYENASCGAHFDGRHHRIWKELSLDSALQLRHAPAGDPRRRIHGHSYTLRLHLHAPLDQVMGWTIDFGDVKQLFDPVFRRFDHKPLHEIAELADCDGASLARWLKAQAAPMLPALDRIDLYETRGCGVVLSWGDLAPALPL